MNKADQVTKNAPPTVGTSYRRCFLRKLFHRLLKTSCQEFIAICFLQVASTLSDYTKLVIPAGKRVSSAMDGKLKSIHGAWIPALIRLERICINLKGSGQDSPE